MMVYIVINPLNLLKRSRRLFSNIANICSFLKGLKYCHITSYYYCIKYHVFRPLIFPAIKPMMVYIAINP